MSDEIAQVVELECKGAYYLIKGTKATIGYIAEFIKHLYDWGHEAWMHRAGHVDWGTLQKVSEANPPVLEFPKEMFEKRIIDGEEMISPFEQYCKEHKLQYCIMPDLNPNDDYMPVAVKSQDMAVHQEQIKSFMNLRIEREQKKDAEYDVLIEKAKAKLEAAKDDGERELAEKELAALVEAKGQNMERLEESKSKLEHDNVIEFTEYLKQGQNTILSKDMDEGFEQMKTCSLVKEFMPSECMTPIRDVDLVPDSKEIYYSQVAEDDTVYTVKRDFELDDNGVVYSMYHVTSGNNAEKEIVFSDKGFTKESWEEQLPSLLKESGMVANAPTTAIHGKERLEAYVDGLERRLQKDTNEASEFEASSKEAEEFIAEGKERRALKEGYEMSMYTTLVVPSASIMPSGEQMTSLELKEGLVEGITVEKMDSETAVVSLKEDEVYRMECMDGSYKEVKGADIVEELNSKSQAVQAHSQSRGRK